MAQVDASSLRGVQLFTGLTETQLAQLAEGAETRSVKAGAPLFLEGDVGSSLFILTKGLVKIVRASEPDTTLTTIQPEGVFGELAVLNSAPRSASAIAIDNSELIEIDKSALDAVFDADPEAARRMLGSLANSLTLAREQVVFHNRVLDEKVRERTEELRETQLEIIRRLGQAAEFRDDDTGLHITRMSRFSARLAMEAGISIRECEALLHAAPMHDIGKIGIPDNILLKPGKLEDEEFEIMKTHTTIGAELLSGSNSTVMELARGIALAHHEKWNGRGYPNGLAGEDIPFLARVCAICDAFDALTSERPYKKAWTPEDAFDLLRKEAGQHFDPHLVELFLGIEDEIRVLMKDRDALLAWTPQLVVERRAALEAAQPE
jgi:HD-GYP domain-containing protein (c-di-GMP phosphodiesterase class II)